MRSPRTPSPSVKLPRPKTRALNMLIKDPVLAQAVREQARILANLRLRPDSFRVAVVDQPTETRRPPAVAARSTPLSAHTHSLAREARVFSTKARRTFSTTSAADKALAHVVSAAQEPHFPPARKFSPEGAAAARAKEPRSKAADAVVQGRRRGRTLKSLSLDGKVRFRFCEPPSESDRADQTTLPSSAPSCTQTTRSLSPSLPPSSKPERMTSPSSSASPPRRQRARVPRATRSPPLPPRSSASSLPTEATRARASSRSASPPTRPTRARPRARPCPGSGGPLASLAPSMSCAAARREKQTTRLRRSRSCASLPSRWPLRRRRTRTPRRPAALVSSSSVRRTARGWTCHSHSPLMMRRLGARVPAGRRARRK